jgi:hypothetical protein
MKFFLCLFKHHTMKPYWEMLYLCPQSTVLTDCLFGLVVRVPSYGTEMYCVSFEVRTGFMYVMQKKVDRPCGRLVVRVPGCRTEMYYVSCEVRTEFKYFMWKKVDGLCGLVVSVPGYRSRGPGSIPGTTRFSEK